MNKITSVLLALIAVFSVSWGVKVKKPIGRPNELEATSTVAWYEGNYSTPVADKAFRINPLVPENYIPVPGEKDLYMVVDEETGKIKGYKKGTEKDGVMHWRTVNPDIPEEYEAVEGIKNLYKFKDKDGKTKYVKYVRNPDDTFCFVPCDSKGNPLDLKNDANKIDKKHYIPTKDNVYKYYNDHGVLVGYRKRVKDKNGYKWLESQMPKDKIPNNKFGAGKESNSNNDKNVIKTDNGNGTYTQTETFTTSEIKNGYQIIYETRVEKIFDIKSGELKTSTKKGPYQVSKKKISGNGAKVNKSLIANTLNGESARVSSQVKYDNKKAEEIIAKANGTRASENLKPLSSNDTADKLAKIKAADMAIHDYSSGNSPLYGTMDQMAKRWNLGDCNIHESVLKTSEKSGSALYIRFMSNQGGKNNICNASAQYIGVGVVKQNGQNYVCLVVM